MTKIIDMLPAMLSGEQLKCTLTVLPDYDNQITNASQAERLLALNSLYDIYLPNDMSVEIYAKLYLALYRSLQKKETKAAIKQSNIIHSGMNRNSVIGGADCLAIIGDSGIGKSCTIARITSVIAKDECIILTKPLRKIIPCISIQTPFDSSVKSLLLEILRVVDGVINTKYYEYAIRSKATTDNLIGTVSQVALQHIGIIIVDEIQNCIHAKQGRNLVGCLTQLINSAGVAIVLVGTPVSEEFFESEMYLARRTQGLHFGSIDNNDFFRELCTVLYKYQYVLSETDISDDMIYWLYEKCQGNISVLVSLIHDAQEIAILNEYESLDKQSIQDAYDKRLASMHAYLHPKQKQYSSPKRKTSVSFCQSSSDVERQSISEIITGSNRKAVDQINSLIQNQLLEEITI